MNLFKRYREVRRELRRAKGFDPIVLKDELKKLEAAMTPKQLEQLRKEYPFL